MNQSVGWTNAPERAGRAKCGTALMSILPCLAAALALAPPAHGQGDARVEVSMAALEHVRGSLPPGRAVLDPRALCRAGLSGWTCPGGVPQRVAALDVELGSREFSYVCIEPGRACSLVNADVLLELEEPRIFGRTARVGVRIWWRTGDPAPRVDRRRSELHLQRSSGAWRVVREESGIRASADLSMPETEEHTGTLRTDHRDQR